LTKEKIKSYVTLLSDLSAEALESGLRRAGQECAWFPSVADIRDRAVNTQLAAEQSFESVQFISRKYWHPDIGFLPGCPEFDGAQEYALRQIGGFRRLQSVSSEHFAFLRRDFIAAHKRFCEEGGEQLRISSAQSRALLGQLTEQRKQLSAAPPLKQAPMSEPMKVPARYEPKQMTEAEVQARIDELREQARRLWK
jgi:hypothetical protein